MSAKNLPDAEKLVRELAKQIEPTLAPKSALVGILTGGAWIAQRLPGLMNRELPVGTLDISFYRDDYGRTGLHPKVKPSSIPFEVEGSDIILVDDVLYTGRTVRAAMNELFDYGRPARIRLAVMVERNGRELPVEAQFVGTTLVLKENQNVALTKDGADKLVLSIQTGLS
jgi:pyrimidine operon attenuation protein/uracil phosphoribosyltransferase